MNSKVIIYDFGTCRIRHELQHGGGVIRLVWHPNNIVLITGCLDGCVYLWDGRTGELLKQLNGHTVVIYTGFHEQDMLLDMSVVVDKNKTYISTVSDDKTCQVFRVEIQWVCLFVCQTNTDVQEHSCIFYCRVFCNIVCEEI